MIDFRGVSPFFFLILPAAGLVFALLLVIAPGGAMAETIQVVPQNATVGLGSSTTFQLVLDSAPDGVSGFDLDVSIDNPETGTISNVSFPSWAMLNNHSALPAGSVRISGVDLKTQVGNGSAGILLATVTVQGQKIGTTGLNVGVRELDSHLGSPIRTTTTPVQIEVLEQASTAVTPTAATGTNSPANTVTENTGLSGSLVYLLLAAVLLVALGLAAYFLILKKK